MRTGKSWTTAEDDKLREAVNQFEDAEQINWQSVASCLEGRNNKECRKRWVYKLALPINKGRWSQDEDTRLRDAVLEHGTRWTAVARVVSSRNADQCARRWLEVLKPNINRDRWSLSEDVTLKNAVQTHGRRWIEIVDRYFPDRTPIAARNRYDLLERRAKESPQSALYPVQSTPHDIIPSTDHSPPYGETYQEFDATEFEIDWADFGSDYTLDDSSLKNLMPATAAIT